MKFRGAMLVNPNVLAEKFRSEIKAIIETKKLHPRLVGVLASRESSSHTYSQFMRVGCEKVGVEYTEVIIDEHDNLEQTILKINKDSSAQGAIVYYPIFGDARDRELREKLSPYKDVEGLHPFWLDKLYSNTRNVLVDGRTMKALLPCTPLAVMKLLASVGACENHPLPLSGKHITIFNRSEVVGKPLAFMLSNDGARVYSFDINDMMVCEHGNCQLTSDITREEALAKSDIVITGVPHLDFKRISVKEVSARAICLNFSSVENFETEIQDHVTTFIPRVGPVTVAMCLRNLVRMTEVFQL